MGVRVVFFVAVTLLSLIVGLCVLLVVASPQRVPSAAREDPFVFIDLSQTSTTLLDLHVKQNSGGSSSSSRSANSVHSMNYLHQQQPRSSEMLPWASLASAETANGGWSLLLLLLLLPLCPLMLLPLCPLMLLPLCPLMLLPLCPLMLLPPLKPLPLLRLICFLLLRQQQPRTAHAA